MARPVGKEAQAVQDDEDGAAFVPDDREGEPQGEDERRDDEDGHDAESEDDVLANDPVRRAGETNCRGQAQKVVAHQYEVGGFQRDVGRVSAQ